MQIWAANFFPLSFLVAVLVLPAEGFATHRDSVFSGFKKDQSSVAAIVGVPIAVRYQRFTRPYQSYFFDVGIDAGDDTILASGSYSWYFLDEGDSWRSYDLSGTILYSVFVGGVAGYYTGDDDDDDEKYRIGARAGGAFDYLFPSHHWSLRVELAPMLYVAGRTAAGVQGGIGIVYFFDGRDRHSYEYEPNKRPAKAKKKPQTKSRRKRIQPR